MCKVHKHRSRADFGWREEREREDGADVATPLHVDIDLSIDPESGGVVVDMLVDIDLTTKESVTED